MEFFIFFIDVNLSSNKKLPLFDKKKNNICLCLTKCILALVLARYFEY